MGFFGTYVWQAGRSWEPALPAINDIGQAVRGDDPPPGLVEPWLLIDIHDSDYTAVTYRPAGPGTGVAYLGMTPRTLFDDETRSAPTDVDREAAGLAAWWQRVHGTAGAVDDKAAELREFLAEDEEQPDVDDEWEDDDEDDDVFVEATTARFLEALGLPVPDELDAEE